MRRTTRPASARGLPVAIAIATIVSVLIVGGVLSGSAAQTPFGLPRAAPDFHASGLLGWLLSRQAEFYHKISLAIREAKSDGSAVWTLLGLSFLYGIFHAAGPGHGKVVISSYLIANEETLRRGVVLSFASALLQSLVAVLIVGIMAWLLNATAKTMCGTERVVEIASYIMIAAFGIRLVWIKGRGFFRFLMSSFAGGGGIPAPALAHSSPHAAPHEHGHTHADHRAQPASHALLRSGTDEGLHSSHRAHDPEGHAHNAHCGHAHGPELSELAGPGGWKRGLAATLTVGVRPCSGAILVLVFALAQGLFWAGIAAAFVMGIGTAMTIATIAIIAVSAKRAARNLASANDGAGVLVMRGLEFCAATLVLLFGAGLLTGYVVAERVTCF